MSYTVLAVSPDTEEWNNKAGKAMVSYKVKFTEHADKVVKWNQSATTAPPQVNQAVEGDIDWNAQYMPKFTRHYAKPDGGNFDGGGGGGTWKPRDPAEIAAIQRQHSQEMALRFLAVNGEAVKATNGKRAFEALDAVVKPLIDWFQRDVNAGVELAKKDGETKQSYGQPKDIERTGQSDAPVQPEQFTHQPVPAGDDIPF
jgi:hypothetical protein